MRPDSCSPQGSRQRVTPTLLLRVEGVFGGSAGAGDRRALGDIVGEGGRERRGQIGDAGVGLREEDGNPSAVVGQFVAAGNAADEALPDGRFSGRSHSGVIQKAMTAY